MVKVHVPYEGATSGDKARAEVSKILRAFGCESIGWMDDFEKHEVLLAFTHRSRPVQLRASAKGWAQLYIKKNPWFSSRKSNKQEWEQAALQQGHVAVNSILRDWVKGQVAAIESGILSFEAVFMPHMLTSDGRTLLARIEETELLPKPQESKVVALPRTGS